MHNKSNLTNKQLKIANLEEQTLEIINYNDEATPKDLFQYYHPQLRRKFVDAYNLMRCWLQNLLFCKKLYPSQAFQVKTAYGRQVHIVRSKILRQYLDNFFCTLSENFENVQYMQVQLLRKDNQSLTKLVESYRCHLNVPFQNQNQNQFKNKERASIKQTSLNTVQKEMCFKRFLDKSEESFKEGIVGNKDIIFKLYMGYNWRQQDKLSSHKMHLLQNWTQKDKVQIEGNINSSADTLNLSIYSQKITFKK